jgi:hypothetical protein
LGRSATGSKRRLPDRNSGATPSPDPGSDNVFALNVLLANMPHENRAGEGDPDDLTVTACHEVELALEWLQRAQGHLLEFHHATGHAMDHLAEAERLLRACGETDLADELRDEHLPSGVVDGDRWSYDVVEEFQAGVLADVRSFERETRERLADGRRHPAERRQERAWKRRADPE